MIDIRFISTLIHTEVALNAVDGAINNMTDTTGIHFARRCPGKEMKE